MMKNSPTICPTIQTEYGTVIVKFTILSGILLYSEFSRIARILTPVPEFLLGSNC